MNTKTSFGEPIRDHRSGSGNSNKNLGGFGEMKLNSQKKIDKNAWQCRQSMQSSNSMVRRDSEEEKVRYDSIEFDNKDQFLHEPSSGEKKHEKKLLSGFGDQMGQIPQSNMQTRNSTIGLSDPDKKNKRRSQRKSAASSGSESGGGAMGCFGVCMGPSAFGSKKQKSDKNKNQSKWGQNLAKKVSEIFEENNQDCIPDWLENFQARFSEQREDIIDQAFQFQDAFTQLIKKLSKKKYKKINGVYKLYKQHTGTIQRYLTDHQFQVMTCIKKQILQTTNHPVQKIALIFREEFSSSYEKYAKPQKNKDGIVDKVSVLNNIKSQSELLKREFQRQSSQIQEPYNPNQQDIPDEVLTEMQSEEDNGIGDINVTNQLIGEVQGFIFVMRWLIYEFYGFRQLKQEGLIFSKDFDAIEDDILYIIHKVTVVNQVYETLLILSRLLNNKDDKNLRQKYRAIQAFQSPFFPIETQNENDNQNMTKVLKQILEQCKSNQLSEKPFQKAITQFRAVMLSHKLSPLDKLYYLQYLACMDHFVKYKGYFDSKKGQVELTTDEMIPIMTYIMIQSEIPDLASQLELITAFASEYMQESPDGCLMSNTYLQIQGCFTYLADMDLNTLKQKNSTGAHYDIDDPDMRGGESPYNNPLDESIIGMGNIIKKAQEQQKRQTLRFAKIKKNGGLGQNDKENTSINADKGLTQEQMDSEYDLDHDRSLSITNPMDQSFDLFALENPVNKEQKQNKLNLLNVVQNRVNRVVNPVRQSDETYFQNQNQQQSIMGQAGTPTQPSSLMIANVGQTLHNSRMTPLVTQQSAAVVSEAQEIENNFLKYNKLAPWKEMDKSQIEEEGLVDYSDTGPNEEGFMNNEFLELGKEHQNVDQVSASMRLYGLINDSEVTSPTKFADEAEDANNRHSSSVNDQYMLSS